MIADVERNFLFRLLLLIPLNSVGLRWLSLALCLISVQGCSPSETDWVFVAPDLQTKIVPVNTSGSWLNALVKPKAYMVRTSLRRFRIGVVRAADHDLPPSDVQTLRERSRAVMLVNASFFDERVRPLGVVVSNGVLRHRLHRGGKLLTGIFTVGVGSVAIVDREEFSLREVIEAVQGGPRLVTKGKMVEGIVDSSRSRRAGACVTKEGEVVFYCVSSLFSGVTIPEVQELLISDNIGCTDALNFDGGGSAQLVVDPLIGERVYSEKLTLSADYEEILSRFNIQGDDLVPVAIGLFLR